MEGGGISGTVAFTGAALQCSQGWVRGCWLASWGVDISVNSY
jgi:hypothetical protein